MKKRRIALVALALVMAMVALAVRFEKQTRKGKRRDPVPLSRFLRAVASGDVPQVDRMLKAGADPDEADEDGKPAMLYAAEGGSTDVVRLLLEAGGEVDAPDRRRILREEADSPNPFLYGTPLARIAGKGDLSMARFLLDHGADADGEPFGEQDVRPVAPLAVAASTGDVAMASLLLERGADVNRTAPFDGSENALSALEIAALIGHRDIVKLLAAHPHDAALVRSALERMRRDREVRGHGLPVDNDVKALLKRIPPTKENRRGRAPDQ